MNEIANNFLLTGDKSMPKLHLRQQEFICSTCGLFTKHLELWSLEIRKFLQNLKSVIKLPNFTFTKSEIGHEY